MWSDTMNWNMTPGLYKRTPGLPTLIVNQRVWSKWCNESCTQWKLNQLAGNFSLGMALVICRTPYHDHPNKKLREQMVISMAVVYVPEHWHLASFTETSFVINPAREKEDTQGMISMTRLHKKAQFYPDVSYGEYKQHMTLLTPPVKKDLNCVVWLGTLQLVPFTGNLNVSARMEDWHLGHLQHSGKLPEVSSR